MELDGDNLPEDAQEVIEMLETECAASHHIIAAHLVRCQQRKRSGRAWGKQRSTPGLDLNARILRFSSTQKATQYSM